MVNPDFFLICHVAVTLSDYHRTCWQAKPDGIACRKEKSDSEERILRHETNVVVFDGSCANLFPGGLRWRLQWGVPDSPEHELSANSLDFPDLGIQLKLTDEWEALADNLLTAPVYGSEVDPVSGVMFDFATDKALAEVEKLVAAGEKDGSKIETAQWDGCKRIFAVCWTKTGEVPMDTVMNLIGGPDKESNVVELDEVGGYTFYFCTYPFAYEEANTLSESSAAKYTRLFEDLETAKDNLVLSEPEERPEVETGTSVTFETTDLDGNKVTSDIFAEHTLILINIWGSFCGPCMEEMPDLEVLSKEFASKDVAFVGVLGDALDRNGEFDEDTVDLAKTVLEAKGMTYLNLAMCQEIQEALPSDTYPTTIFIDSTGTVVGEVIYGSRTCCLSFSILYPTFEVCQPSFFRKIPISYSSNSGVEK